MANDDRPLFEKPLEDLLPPDPPKRARLAKDDRRQEYDLPPRELVAIARLQKQLLSLILYFLMAGLFVGGVILAMLLALKDYSALMLVFVMWLLWGILWVLALIVLYKLAKRLYPDSALALLLVSICMPIVGGVILLILNAKVGAILRRNGIRVGLYGARAADLPRIEKREPTTLPKLGW